MDANDWVYYCDGASGTGGRRTGVAVAARDRAGCVRDAASRCLPGMTNNEAEYEALLLGLELALGHRAAWERTRGGPARPGGPTFAVDSQIVVGQVAGSFAVRDVRLAVRHAAALRLLRRLPGATLVFVPRERNRLADALACETLASGQGIPSLLLGAFGNRLR